MGGIGGIVGGVPGTAPPPPPVPSPVSCGTFAADKPLRFGGNIPAAALVKQVPPVYPSGAKAARVQGTVEFER